ncbi:cyclic nucleotide-gated cation channel alpha-3-like [Paramacrobiotus metropolitanus]|uniref:cyclic nucleotide-gated cation channel alpha-3-like n=1 Tax=Paramacrobiotus metropolitanus TaxID=2943436 RepID=UPI0024458246|nr:cyclic nucleotide-gated cation channel alpha-3-like [Paramacrobiotus metropolitanus]
MDQLSNSSDHKSHTIMTAPSGSTGFTNKRPSEAIYLRKSSGARNWFQTQLNRLRGGGGRRNRRHFAASTSCSPNDPFSQDLTGRAGRLSRSRSPAGSQHDKRHSVGQKKRFLQTLDAQEIAGSLSSADRRTGCRWTFVFDPSGRLAYYWSCVVSIAFLYNLWVIVYRFSFQEINSSNVHLWMPLDYFADILYLCDIAFNFRTGYLEDGVLQTEPTKLRMHYMNTTLFYVDCLCLLPLDILYLSLGFNSALRSFRLVKIYRFWGFLDRTERHTNYPNVFRSVVLIHYLLALFHWNACIYYLLSSCRFCDFRANWSKPEDQLDTVRLYLYALYWSTLFLTNVGDIPRPESRVEHIFVILELICGLLLFATVLGHIANIVANVAAARKEFQAKLDNVKTYMNLRRVPDHLQKKVIKWFDYLWMTKKSSDEEKSVMACLPDKLKAEIAIHVHLDTLKRVEIFQNTEAGFLCELVLRLRPVLFSPGDYICRKGEVGKDMYIVARGKLQVVADNGRTVLATLKAGSYFGEISVLNMGTLGNRRTASVRSVGYSDLFCLSKQDMWDVLQEYPAARVRLEAIAQKRLRKYEKSPLEKASMNRSQSTPGLVEPGVTHSPRIDRATIIRMPSMPAGLPGQSFMDHTPSLPHEQGPAHVASDPSATTLSLPASTKAPLLQLPDRSKETAAVLIVPSALPMSSSRTGTGYHSPQPPHSMTASFSPLPSVPMSTAPVAAVTTTAFQQHLTVPNRRPVNVTSSHTVSRSTTPGALTLIADDGHHCQVTPSTTEELIAEIRRLRERLVQLETENASMSIKLSQQQWEVEHRLAEIEMHICAGSESPTSGSDFSELTVSNLPTLEKPNRESVI